MMGYAWTLHGNHALDFLRDVQPHVHIKREQVDLALKFPVGRNRRHVTDEERALRADIYRQLKVMKRSPPLEAPVALRRRLESDAFVARAAALYKDGLSCREVGEEMGMSDQKISYWLRQLGLKRPKDKAIAMAHAKRLVGLYDRPEVQEAKRLYAEGLSALEVAKRLKRKPATVNYWLRKLGLTRSLSGAAKLRREKEG